MGYKVVALGEKYLRTISERRPVGYVKNTCRIYVNRVKPCRICKLYLPYSSVVVMQTVSRL